MDMRSVCRNRSDELDSALIQIDGHGVQILTRASRYWVTTRQGPDVVIGWRVFLSEPVKTQCTAVDLSRKNSCLSMSIMSEPLYAMKLIPHSCQGISKFLHQN